MKNFRELIVWQKSMSLTTQIYSNTASFPKEEMFGITLQIRRCSVSIPSNIAEGFGRNTTNEFIRFLRISMGSLFELQTQLEISKDLNFIAESTHSELEQKTIEVEKMLKALIKSLKQ